MTPAIEKMQRELAASDAAITAILTMPGDDPRWGNDAFWGGRWLAMVDRFANAVEKTTNAMRKESERQVELARIREKRN